MCYLKEIVNVAEKERFVEIKFPLKIDAAKPIFLSMQNKCNNQFGCMLDSGASIPVWCSGKETLELAFPKVECRKDLKGLLSGFGKDFELADVYYIPRIVLYNGEHSIVFNRAYLPVVNKDSFGANLILPSSIFKDAKRH